MFNRIGNSQSLLRFALLFVGGVVLGGPFLAGSASAQLAGVTDDKWTGAASPNWSNTGNWSLVAVPGPTNAVRFDQNSTANLNTNQDIPNLSISGIVNTALVGTPNVGASGPVSITGSPITVGATGLIMVSGNPLGPYGYTGPAQADLTVDVDLSLSADQRWKMGGPGAATTAQPSGNQALIVGASANGHTVTLNGFKPILTVISNANDQIIVNSKLVDGSVPSSVGISKATGTASTLTFDSGNINTTPRVRLAGDNTYSGGTDIIGGRQLIQLASNSPFGSGAIAIHTESLVSGAINNQAPYFSPFGADRTLSNDINLNNVLTSTGSTPVQSYPTLYNAGSADDATGIHSLTLNGAISVPTNASLLENSAAAAPRTSAPGDLIVNGTVLLGGADFNSDGKVDAADYVSWRANPAARGGADGYRIWRENFGTTIATPDGNPITTGTFSTGQTASATVAPGRVVYNGNILQTNNAAYTVSVQNGSAAQPTIVQLYGQNTYSGGTSLTTTDPSSPTSPANLGVGSSSTVVSGNIVSGPLGTGTLTVGTTASATTASIEALGGARTIANPISVPNLTAALIVRGSNDLTLSGNITGSGGVTMNGTGKLTLSGTNSTFLNFTNVNSGTLLVNGTLTASGAQVAAGATVGGTGTIGAGITNSGTIAPGASGVGTLNIGTASLNGNVTDNSPSAWAIDLSGTSSDLLAVTGNITLSGGDSLNVSGVGSGSSWIIASYTGTLTGTFGSVTPGYSLDYGTGANSVITLHTTGSGATQSAVPEPASVWLGMFGIGLVAGCRRRRA